MDNPRLPLRPLQLGSARFNAAHLSLLRAQMPIGQVKVQLAALECPWRVIITQHSPASIWPPPLKTISTSTL